jgi:hypothetical protein
LALASPSCMQAMKIIRILKVVRAAKFLRKLNDLEEQDNTQTLFIVFKVNL